MPFISIFNDVLGPVMRGPSSSHTAGSFHIAKMVRSLLEEDPHTVEFTFDKNGSYARVFRQQGADLALTCGLLGISLTDTLFFQAFELAEKKGLTVKFNVKSLKQANHPNFILIKLTGKSKKKLIVEAQSVGGGMINITSINGYNLLLYGKAEESVFVCTPAAAEKILLQLEKMPGLIEPPVVAKQKNKNVIVARFKDKLDAHDRYKIESSKGVEQTWNCSPVFFLKKGNELFTSAEQMIVLAEEKALSLGEIALSYEANLLGISEKAASEEILRRYHIMRDSVNQGLDENHVKMQLLEPTAGKIIKKLNKGALAFGGAHTRAAARAMAVMHTNNSMGIVCAAPTGGSAGTIPGVITTLVEEKKMKPDQTVRCLFAASAIGLIVAHRATFAAEIAGCQVEIGAAGAMAAASVVESAGGTPRQACDAAAISFQNTMGSVCDLVQGACEIPCHTRNAVAASGAFVCADLILGGYKNPIPLDETIDAVYSVGRMLPSELRCTARGGLATTPSGQKLHICNTQKDRMP